MAGDAFCGGTNRVWARRNRGGDERSCAVRGQGASHGGESFFGALHYVVAASAVYVDVDKTGNGDLAGCVDFLGALGQRQTVARADRFDHTIANENASIVNFSGGRIGTWYMQECGGHGEKTIVTKIKATVKQNGQDPKPCPK